MTPAARLAAAIEVLDDIAASRGPADGALKAWGREHRYAGSGDRRAIALRVYACLRARAKLAWRMGGESGRALVIGSLGDLDGLALPEIEALCSGEGHAPALLNDDERARLCTPAPPAPAWVEAGVPPFVAEGLQQGFGADWPDEAKSLIAERAPVDLRVNALRGSVEQAMNLLRHDKLSPERTPFSAWGLRLPPDAINGLEKLRAFTSGWVEVQDEGSQLSAFLAGPRPGWTVVDYCAGGGGKTLALAMQMGTGTLHLSSRPERDARSAGTQGDSETVLGPALGSSPRVTSPPDLIGGSALQAVRDDSGREGRLIALDVNAKRLDAMRPRLARAGVQAEVRRIGPEGQGAEDLEGRADLVLVDAPCSGSGTWRRHPEGAWRITPEAVARLCTLQRQILARAARLVKPGGRLGYITCSVLPAENDAVAADFALLNPEFRPLSIAEAARTPDLTDAARARLAELSGGGHTLQLTPRRAGTDGFFIALFERQP